MEQRRRAIQRSVEKRLPEQQRGNKSKNGAKLENETKPVSGHCGSVKIATGAALLLIILGNVLSAFVMHKLPLPSSSSVITLCDEAVLHKDAKSAISRAKSQSCRHQLEQIACDSMAGVGIYPKFVPSFCQVQIKDQDLREAYVGCYKDNFSSRLLEGPVNRMKKTNSPKECVRYCAESGYDYAGVQYSFECFCGNSKANDSNRIDELECNIPCPGDSNAFCGGYLTMNIYQSRFLPETSQKSKNISNVKVAYLFVVHGRSLRQILRLFKLLYNPLDYYYFHVDSRSAYLYRNLKSLESRFSTNVRVTDNRWATIWGGASLLKMMISCLKEMVNLNWNFDYFINLSESDYVLKHPSDFKEFLLKNWGKNFVKSHGRNIDTFVKKQGLDRTFHECDNHMFRLGPRSLPNGITLDGGSDWVCLNRPFINYFLEEKDPLLNSLFNIFNYTLLPAESFFHTALKNSRFCSSYVNNNLRITNWKRQLGCQCQHKAVVDWCGCSPNVFKLTDWKKIANSKSRPIYFARKFDPTISQSILNDIDEWIFQGSNLQVGQDKYWENIFHIDDDDSAQNVNFDLATRLANQCIEKFNILKDLKGVTQITAFYEHDHLVSILVMLESNKYECRHDIVTRTKLDDVELTVSSGFDVKELIFRNPMAAVGPFVKPQLLVQFKLTDEIEETVGGTVLWISPTGDLVASNRNLKVNMSAGYTLVNFPSHYERPIEIGVWTAAFTLTNGIKKETDFLVIGNRAVVEAKEASEKVDGESEAAMLALIKNRKFAEKHYQEAAIDQWINSKFVTVDACLKDDIMNPCHKTSWSSLSPDSKSTIEL